MTEGIFALIFANFLGGAFSPLFVRIGTSEIPPITFTALRFLVATLVFFPIFLSQRKKFHSEDFPKIIFNSIFFMLNATLFAIGLRFTTIITSQILYTLVPLFVGLFSFFLFKEKIGQNKIIGAAIALSGTAFLIWESFSKVQSISLGTPLGNVIILCAVISWSFYFSFSKKLTDRNGPVVTTFFSFLITLLIVGIISPFEFSSTSINLNHLRPEVIGSIFGVGIISSGALVFLYQYGISKTSSFVASIFTYFVPVFSSLTAIPLAHEKISGQLIIGGLLITIGVFYATSYSVIKGKLKSN